MVLYLLVVPLCLSAWLLLYMYLELKKQSLLFFENITPERRGNNEIFGEDLEDNKIFIGERERPFFQPETQPRFPETVLPWEDTEPTPDIHPESDSELQDREIEDSVVEEEKTLEHDPSLSPEQEVTERIEALKTELQESAEPGHGSEEPTYHDPETPAEEGEDGDGGEGRPRSLGWSETIFDYEPCPTCYKKLRYLILRCPQCKGRGSIPRRSTHRTSIS